MVKRAKIEIHFHLHSTFHFLEFCRSYASDAMSAVKELIGDLLMNSSAQTVEASSITNELSSESFGKRVLGLYFSAHWCPPCRDFTPVLVEFYNRFKKSAAAYCLVDIVFVSSDHDEESFIEYLKEMPWPAIPYNDRLRKVSCYEDMSVVFRAIILYCSISRCSTGLTPSVNGLSPK